MITGGVPDLFRLVSLTNPINDTRRALTEASSELVTGRKENLGKALGAEAGRYSIVTKALSDIETDGARLTLTDNRLLQTGQAITAVRSALEGIGAEVDNLRASFPVNQEEVSSTGRAGIEAVLGFLNTDLGGRRLFSGEEVSRPAVAGAATFFTEIETAIGGATDLASIDAAITAFFGTGGGFETAVYTGGAGTAADVELRTGNTVEFGIKADDQAFRTTLEAYARLVYLPQDAAEASDAAGIGADQVRDAESLLIALEAEVGRQRGVVADAETAAAAEKTVLLDSEDDLAGVDSYEAATRFQQLEGQLQAAYTVTARLSRLTLTNFVR